jgi:Fe-S-cluster containining protein
MNEKIELPFNSRFVPVALQAGDRLRFNCHKGVSCYNACCKQADVQLTPYDILRLKENLGITATEFLRSHTVPFEMDKDGVPGVKLRTDDDGACHFVAEAGCQVYKDRPTACRYYPLGHLAMKEANAKQDEAHYFLIQEDHCKGHQQPQQITVDEYRQHQQFELYDQINRDWLQLMLKKRSAGPAIGRPSDTSLQFFFMCSYDLDRLRRFVLSDAFKTCYAMDELFYESVEREDLTLMQFGVRLLKQVLFGEITIPLRQNALQQRIEARKAILDMRKQAELEMHRHRQEQQIKDALTE